VRGLSAEVKTRILALNPEQVTEQEVRDLLSQAPAPRMISIHGGLLPIRTGMNSFARFLIGMGYPESSIRNPGNGLYTYGYYDRSDEIAGAVAWYYERDGLRPVLVGHSQGGIQAIRVLHKLAGDSATTLSVWNPVTQSVERRYEITDPLTGMPRPVVGVQVSYATAVVAGGLARLLPNEWDMNNKLRKIPDSVVEFTGFQKGLDPLGGDFLGYGPANDYRPTGSARVRNVRLPSASPHSTIPYTQSLLRRPEIRQWIDQYDPNRPREDRSGPDSDPEWMNARILWAAEVWHSIKKHWVLELQRLIRAQRALSYEPDRGRSPAAAPQEDAATGDRSRSVAPRFMVPMRGPESMEASHDR
jgi:pimeloyl-ACP methyl ester carboxylesterase